MWLTAPRKSLGIDCGAELDIANFNPDQKEGQVLMTNAGFPVITNAVDLNAAFFGVNVLTRLPIDVTPEFPNGRWFPYVGIGGGGQRLSHHGSGSRDTSRPFKRLEDLKYFCSNTSQFLEKQNLYMLRTRWNFKIAHQLSLH
jgi:hypothetical protein